MSEKASNFELPRNIERYLAALSKIYANEGNRKFQEIIVNAQIRIHEEYYSNNSYGDNYYTHALYLVIPEPLFLSFISQKDYIQTKIKNDLNKIHNVQDESIAEVFLEMEITENHDWRKESGLLLNEKRIVLPDAENRIWGGKGFRVFLSHKADVKKQTAGLKERLKLFGVSCFVAHEDIHPTKEWQIEIENALFSMDGFVALMTDGFHDSFWTDQEVGVAIGRGVPIIPVKLGLDPYGFIGKFQALSCSWDTATLEIVKLLMVRSDRILNAYIHAIESCQSFDDGNVLSEILPSIVRLSVQQVQNLISAFNNNGQVRGSYGFNGYREKGLTYHLRRVTGEEYKLLDSGKIEIDL